ncbi:MAG: hypothetical protein AAB692_04235, partial [Patescibacteria group bacterium]
TGASHTAANQEFLNLYKDATGWILNSDKSGTGTVRELSLATGNLRRLNIDSFGNVGIGTTSPGNILDIAKDQDALTRETIDNQSSGTSARTGLTISALSNSQSLFSYPNANTSIAAWTGRAVWRSDTTNGTLINPRFGNFQIQMGTESTTPQLTIDSSGNVGIGTTNPATALHVVGSATVSGNYLAQAGATQSSGVESNTVAETVRPPNMTVVVPSDGLPVIAWIDGISGFQIKKCTTVNCSATGATTVIDGTATTTTGSNFGTITSDGFPFFAYERGAGTLGIIHCTNVSCSASNTSVATSVGSVYRPSTVTYGDGSVGISYERNSTSTIYYTRCTDPTAATPCSTVTSSVLLNSADGSSQGGSDLEISSDNFPIVFLANGFGTIKAVKCSDADCSGSTTITDIVGITGFGRKVMGTARQTSGNVVFASYSDGPLIRYTKCANASCSSSSTVTISSSGSDSIADVEMTSANTPVVAFVYSGPNTAKVTVCGDDACSAGNSTTTITPAPTGFFAGIGMSSRLNSTGDLIFAYGNNASNNLLVARVLLSSTITSGTDVGSSGTKLANAFFYGDIHTGNLIADGTSPNGGLTVNGNSALGDGTGNDKLTVNMGDNIADAVDVQQSGNNYINIATTNSAENIAFGNATTNPSFSFLGTGTTSFSGPASLIANKTIASASGAIWDGFTLPAAVATITGSTNITTATGLNLANMSQSTLSSGSALTVSHSASMFVNGAPIAGGAGPTALMNAYGLRIGAGSALTNTTNGYGLFVDAPTGATNNYAAIFNTGNVGIGTTAPANKLDVEGSLAVGATYSGTSTAPTNGAIIEGNVGIGMTNPTVTLPLTKLGVGGTNPYVTVTGGTNEHMGLNFVENTTREAVVGWLGHVTPKRLSMQVYDGVSAVQEYLDILQNGNVGIGTSNPLYKLHVNTDGAATFSTFSTWSSTSAVHRPIFNFTRGRGTQASPTAILNGDSIGSIGFQGQVDTTVGTGGLFTSSLIHVVATENWSGSNNGSEMQFYTAPNGAMTSGGTQRMTISNAGNVGIGDTSPDDLLNIHSASAQAALALTSLGTDTDPVIKFELADGTSTFAMGVDDSDSDKFKIGTTAIDTNTRLTIDSSGNVGIGTTTPGASLEIKQTTGDGRASQWLTSGTGVNSYATTLFGEGSAGGTYAEFIRYANANTAGGSGGRFIVANIGKDILFSTNDNSGYSTDLYIQNGGNVGIGTASPTGNLAVTQTATATGALKGIVYTGAVNTNQTLSTEIPSLTLTTAGRQWATGALTIQREVLITQPTYSFVGASTITDAATIGIAGAPIKSTNASITNTHALLIQAGAVSTATNSYGLTVNAQTGATNNYAAAFLGGNVGIGTATPGARFEVHSSSGLMQASFLQDADADLYLNMVNQHAGRNDFIAFSNTTGTPTGVRPFWSEGRLYYADDSYAINSYDGTTNSARILIAPTGNVGIGDTSPTQKLDVTGNIGVSDTTVIDSSRRFFAANGALGAGTLAYSFSADTNTGIYGTGADILRLATAGADRMTIDSAGNVGIGTTSPSGRLHVVGNSSPAFLFTGETTAGYADLYQSFAATSTGASAYVMRKARGTLAAPTVVAAEDRLGIFIAQGYDGSAYNTGAAIHFYSDATSGVGDMPGRIEFKTTADGGTAEFTRMTIKNNGNVGIGTISPATTFQVTSVQYNTGTAGQALAVITGVGTTWTSAMVGSVFVFADGTRRIITALRTRLT